jgi:leucyl aminopeptidase
MTVSLHEPDQPLKALAVVIGIRPAGRGVALADGAELANDLLGGHLPDALRALHATGRAGEVLRIPTVGHAEVPLVVATGLGPATADAPAQAEATRRAVGAAVRGLAGTARIAISIGPDDPATIAAIAEGAVLGAYRFDTYRTDPGPRPPGTVRVVAARTPANRAALAAAVIRAEAAQLARDLVNTPPNELYPRTFADRVVALAETHGLTVEVLDEAGLAEGGYGGILGVGAGSAHPPRLVRLTHRPEAATRTVALVGKGITYDSGGLNLKQPAPVDMKADMAGAAAVVAATVAAARLELPITVIATVPMAENMPSGSSYRPADVLRMRGGKTVEVVNTDAEGRLILADAIVRAGEDNPDYLIETSTLTGAQVVALGQRTAAVMGEAALVDRVVAAGTEVGEPMWPMPLPEDVKAELRSEVADLRHTGTGRAGGMLIAGHFLSEFVPAGLPWAHLDVAGPAGLNSKPFGYVGSGATGVPARTLIALLAALAE